MSAEVMNRRAFLRAVSAGAAVLSVPVFGLGADRPARRPNILLAIADDQSWLSTSMARCKFVNTPGFDRIARGGVLFAYAYAPAPSAVPRAAV